MNTISWEELVALEPALQQLLDDIRRVKDDKRRPSFCTNHWWYGRPTWLDEDEDDGFRGRLIDLVGYVAMRPDEPRLRTSDAYMIAYDTLYDALPGCRNCGCP